MDPAEGPGPFELSPSTSPCVDFSLEATGEQPALVGEAIVVRVRHLSGIAASTSDGVSASATQLVSTGALPGQGGPVATLVVQEDAGVSKGHATREGTVCQNDA